jgi:hypothetical protein
MAVIGGRALAGRVSMRLGEFERLPRESHCGPHTNVPSQLPLEARSHLWSSALFIYLKLFTDKASRPVHDLFQATEVQASYHSHHLFTTTLRALHIGLPPEHRPRSITSSIVLIFVRDTIDAISGAGARDWPL